MCGPLIGYPNPTSQLDELPEWPGRTNEAGSQRIPTSHQRFKP